MFQNKFVRKIQIAFIAISLIVTFIVTYNCNKLSGGFQFLWIWPLSYFISMLFLFMVARFRVEHSIALFFTFYVRYFARHVAYPLSVIMVGEFYSPTARFISLNDSDIVKAILICTVEIVLVSVFFAFYEYSKKTKMEQDEKEETAACLYGSRTFYYFVIILAIVLLIVYGVPRNLVSFFKVETVIFELSNSDMLIKYLIVMGLAIAVMMVFDTQYKSTKSELRRVFVCLIASVLFTGLIQGGSRAFQSYVAFILITILIGLFPRYKRMIIISIASAFVFVLLILTIAREGVDSGWFNGIQSLSNKLQIYFGGPTSIANPIKVFEQYESVDIFNLIFDYISLFPMSLLIGDWGHTTSELYNLCIYSGASSSGHIVFAPAYGYIYFGILGIPITMCLNILICCYFNKKFYKSHYFETKYLYGFCLFRTTSGLLTHPPQYLSGILQYLIIMGLIIISSHAFKNKGKIYL